MAPPSGEQFRIEHGPFAAVVTEVGATLRGFSVEEHPVLFGFGEDEMCSGGRGQVLAPWPNRIGDGFYVFRGVTAQAPIDEISKHNAIHGLVRWRPFRVVAHERASVELETVLHPQPAYPFPLHLSIAYLLSEEGLTVRARAEGDGRPTPFGIGFHPYFLAASQGLAEATIEVPAKRHLLLDDQSLPDGSEPVTERFPALVAPGGLSLDTAVLDDCFSKLDRDEQGVATIRFRPGGGPIEAVELRLDAQFDHVMCFTGDTLDVASRRRAVAIEPMTCPPNAFVSGDSVRDLGSGVPFEASWSALPILAG